MSLDYQLIIPMSGRGERFRREGYASPKYLLPVGTKPIIQHTLEMFPGCRNVLLIINQVDALEHGKDIEQIIRQFGPHIELSVIETHKDGPGGALLRASHKIHREKPVVVNYCDFGWIWNYNEFLSHLANRDGVIVTYSGFHPHMLRSTNYAYLRHLDGKVVDIREKESFTENRFNEYASSGTYGFGSGQMLIDALREQAVQDLRVGNELYISLTYLPLLQAGYDIRHFPIPHFFQWGTPEDYEIFRSSFALFDTLASRPTGFAMQKKRSVVLLAAGKGERFRKVGYELPKPVLDLAGEQTWLQAMRGFGPALQRICVTRNDIKSHFHADPTVELVGLDRQTDGQAVSALRGLEIVRNDDSEVVVASCDAVFPFGALSHTADTNSAEVVVWTARPTRDHIRNASSYCWVAVDDKQRVIRMSMKELPPDVSSWQIVTGTFTFKNRQIATRLSSMVLDSGLRHNGEIYLDFVVEIALREGIAIAADLRDDFVGLGTPAEYESYTYWRSAFHHWRESFFTIETDALTRLAS